MNKNSTPFKELSNEGANDTKGKKQGRVMNWYVRLSAKKKISCG
jgi:hypothetical protein